MNVQTHVANQPAKRKSATSSSEPDSNINLPPQPMLNVAVSSTEVPGQRASDAAVQPVFEEAAADHSLTLEEQPAASMTTQDASSPPSQLRSSKRSTQRMTKSKSSSVSDVVISCCSICIRCTLVSLTAVSSIFHFWL